MTPWFFLFLSIALHILFLLGLAGVQPVRPQEKSVEVTLVEKPQVPPMNIVRQAEVPPDLLAKAPKKAKYLSERDQSVLKETQSKLAGLTRNATKANKPKESTEEGFGQLKKMPTLAELTPPVHLEPSTNGQHLDEVKDGPMTALNTERFVYYGFFSRIEERVRPLWERNLHETENHFTTTDLRRNSSRVFLTQIEVLLNPHGDYLDSVLITACGNNEIDRDAIRAFEEAKYFPNPPKELVEGDGRIHLRYDLRFSMDEMPFSRRLVQ